MLTEGQLRGPMIKCVAKPKDNIPGQTGRRQLRMHIDDNGRIFEEVLYCFCKNDQRCLSVRQKAMTINLRLIDPLKVCHRSHSLSSWVGD